MFAASKDQIEFVVVDLVMPERGGDDCIRALREIEPSATIVLCSGFDRDGIAPKLLAHDVTFLQKPYTLDRLRRAVEVALDRRRSA